MYAYCNAIMQFPLLIHVSSPFITFILCLGQGERADISLVWSIVPNFSVGAEWVYSILIAIFSKVKILPLQA